MSNEKPSPYGALHQRNFRLYFAGSVLGVLGIQMQNAIIGWELYNRTQSSLALGLVGLVQVIPILLLAPLGGDAADRYSRRHIIIWAQLVIGLGALGLAAIAWFGISPIAIYALLFVIGIARSFQGPARSSLLPQLVTPDVFPNAVTWNSGGFQLAQVLGPALGGLLLAWTKRPYLIFSLNAVASLSFAFFASRLRPLTVAPRATEKRDWATILAGFRFVWQTPVMLGALTLDLFAVLLGGAVALLPVYAKDILQVGSVGFGWMESAPAIGAVLMTWILTNRPPIERAGKTLLWAVAIFGTGTIIFGLSRFYPLSLLMLFLLGAADQISVVIRSTIVQLATPDAMRGRVSAVNGMFIVASNELGRFESGMAAAAFGPIIAVVGGGIGTILVVIFVAVFFVTLRNYGRLGDNLQT